MENGGWVDLLRLVPEKLHDKLLLMTADGSEVAVQNLIRLEPQYVVLRGRIAGTSDTGLAFFIPYDRIAFVRFLKPVPEAVIYGLYGVTPPEAPPVEATPKPGTAAGEGQAGEGEAPAAQATPAQGINRKELLERLRNRLKPPARGKPGPPKHP
jgi:hypothetical protein